MNNVKTIPLLFIFLLLTACSGEKPGAAPQLLEPAGITYDTTIVRREDISVVTQYSAYVKSYSEGLYFTKNNLRIKSIDVMVGDYVSKGDIIATLDTEQLDLRIQKQEEYMADLRKQYSYANQTKNYDIQIALVEQDGLYLTNADAERQEQKKYQIERLRLELTQLYETQQLELKRQTELLDELKSQLDGTVLTAPFDGTVVYQTQLYPGSTVASYIPVAYIADDSKLYVKYTGSEYFRALGVEKITGRIEDRTYELQYAALSSDEYLKYVLAGDMPPVTFNFVNIDDSVKTGQFISITATSSSAENVLTVPVNSIYYGEAEEGSYVYVMENNQKILRSVELGIRNNSIAEVKNGLQEGDEVFVKQ